MAKPSIILLDSFDTYPDVAATKRRWPTHVNPQDVSIVTASGGRSGRALHAGPNGAATYTVRTLPAIQGISVGFWFRWLQLPDHNNDPASFLHLMKGGTSYLNNQVGLGLNTSGQILVFTNAGFTAPDGTTIATVTQPLSEGVWYWLELQVYVHSTAGWVKLRVNSTEVVSLTNQNTNPQNNASIDNVGLISGYSSIYEFDDVVLSDLSSGSDFFGPSNIGLFHPNADTAQSDFTPSSGVDNYAMVDEVQSDGNTSYVTGSVLNNSDLYTTAGISEDPITIHGVQVTTAAIKTTGIAFLSAKMLSNGSALESTPLSLDTSIYYDSVIASNVDPDGNADWTKLAIQALLMGQVIKDLATTTFSQTLDSNYTFTAKQNFRIVLAAASLSVSGSYIKVKLTANTSADSVFTGVSIGPRSGTTANFSSSPTRVTFGGSNGVTVTAGGSVWSDWIAFSLNEASDYLVHLAMVTNTNNPIRYAASTSGNYSKATDTDETMTQDVSGYSNASTGFVTEVAVGGGVDVKVTQVVGEVLYLIEEVEIPTSPVIACVVC